MAETVKTVEHKDFKGGVMSPNSQRTFAELRHVPTPATPKQKIILDEESFEHSFLRCMLCKERYNMSERCPRLLPCHHAFCLACLLHVYQREEDYRQSLAPISSTTTSNMAFAVSISCPTCSANFISTLEGLKQLTTDHRIVQLMDFVGATDKQTITFCPNHALQPLNFFCEKCVQAICRDCTVLDHKLCAQDLLVIDLTSATEKYIPALDEGVTSMSDEAKSLTEKAAECQQAMENCQKGDDTLTKSIKESFAKLRKALDEREQEILDMAGNPVKCTEVITNKIAKLSEKAEEVGELSEAINKAKMTGKVQEMFLVFKRIREYETECGIDLDELQKNDQPPSTFNKRDEQTILSKISNYGEIQSSLKKSNGYSSSSGSGYTSGSSYMGNSSAYSTYSPSPYTSQRYAPRTYKY